MEHLTALEHPQEPAQPEEHRQEPAHPQEHPAAPAHLRNRSPTGTGATTDWPRQSIGIPAMSASGALAGLHAPQLQMQM